MKVLNLQCAHQHVFEGWFASEDDFNDQQSRGLVTCPLCGDAGVRKMLSAPRLNLRTARGDSPAPAVGDAREVAVSNHPAHAELAELQARMLRAMREIVAQTEDVGERFADQARAMHHGDIEHRNIRGRTTAEEAVALLEEGVEVLPLPMLPALKDMQ